MICTHGKDMNERCEKCESLGTFAGAQIRVSEQMEGMGPLIVEAPRYVSGPQLGAELSEPIVLHNNTWSEGFQAGLERERQRIRALFLRHYANYWNATDVLKEIDNDG